jgi:translation elongation factor EF-Ts
MANFTIADIKSLRDQLGTGMVDTKKALEEADGDVEKAVEILRLKGAKGNAKRADRSTSEGLVTAREQDGRVTLVELACETDFVAKNELHRTRRRGRGCRGRRRRRLGRGRTGRARRRRHRRDPHLG